MVLQNPEILRFSIKQLKYIFKQRQFLYINKKIEIVELRFGNYGEYQVK